MKRNFGLGIIFILGFISFTVSANVPYGVWANFFSQDGRGSYHGSWTSAVQEHADIVLSISQQNNPSYSIEYTGPSVIAVYPTAYETSLSFEWTDSNGNTNTNYSIARVYKIEGFQCWDGSFVANESDCPEQPECEDGYIFDIVKAKCVLEIDHRKQHGSQGPGGASGPGGGGGGGGGGGDGPGGDGPGPGGGGDGGGGGNRCNSTFIGNPINFAIGNKYQSEIDYLSHDLSNLRLVRSYNSGNAESGSLGVAWRHNYERDLSFNADNTQVFIELDDGRTVRFRFIGDTWYSEPDIVASFTEVSNGWEYRSGDIVETYTAAGRLQSITTVSGLTQTLMYNADDQLIRVDGIAGEFMTLTYHETSGQLIVIGTSSGNWGYRYDTRGVLEYIDNPDGTSRRYHYEDILHPYALTGITDERGIRYATFGYDSLGRGILSTHANNVGKVNITYPSNLTRTVTNSRGATTTYTMTRQNGSSLLTDVAGPGCSACGSGDTSFTYDPYNNIAAITKNNIITEYGNYDLKGNYGFKVEAKGTVNERRTDYTYDSRFSRKVATITEPSVYSSGNKVTTFTYDNFANITSLVINGFTPAGDPISRETTYTYNGPYNQLSSVNGPRTDVTDVVTLNYYPDDSTAGYNRARLKEIVDPNGLLTRDNIQYTATGKIASETRSNGLSLIYSYYAGNDRLKTTTESDGVTSKTTSWTYLTTGEVSTITLAAGSTDSTTTTLAYDDARRLIKISDAPGNYIQYQLDEEGNHEKEQIFDSGNVLRRSLTQTFDLYNRVDISLQANETINKDYALDGTLDIVTDGKGAITDYSYDSLKRLVSTMQDVGGTDIATRNVLTQYTYNLHNRLTTVTDPNGGTTTNLYDDLGNLLSQSSPDTGTFNFTYDSAGNVATKIDAKGQVFNYIYNANSQLTYVDAPGNDGDITYTYGGCVNGDGRLCDVSNSTSSLNNEYDAFGNLTRHQSSQYDYDGVNRLKSITYPSGNTVNYTYDNAGNVNDVNIIIDGISTNIASNIQYAPFGPVTRLTYGDGLVLDQAYDDGYRITGQTIPNVLQREYSQYDSNGNLLLVTDGLYNDSHEYTYDALNRLVNDGTPGGGSGSGGSSSPEPIARYSFENDYIDSTGNGFDGIPRYEPGLQFVTGQTGQGIKFNYGSIDVNGLTTIEGINNYTLSAWVNIPYAGNGKILSKARAWHAGHFSLRCLSNQCGIFNNAGRAAIDYSNYLNEWHHWAGTYDNGTLRFYLDGQLVAESTAVSTTSLNTTLSIGAANGGYHSLWNGYIDEVMLFNETLAAEVIPLIGVAVPPAHSGGLVYEYDVNGNRLAFTDNADINSTYQYEQNTNRLSTANGSAIALDANGNTVSDFRHTYSYNVYNRLSAVNTTISYSYNGVGQRVSKTVDGIQTTFVYDTSGSLLGEYQNGNPVNEYIYLNETPVAVIKQNNIYFIHTDHLGTPRKITDINQTPIWEWSNSESFGNNLANSDPDGDGNIFEYNQRLAGQYYDVETGLHYNYFRYYDPSTGRYITSDPIGLAGGLNTYGYVGGNPLKSIDLYGLATWPTDYTNVTDPYGSRGGNHTGADIRNPVGGNVYAADSGKVIGVYNNPKGGNQIRIQHPDGSVTGYAHTAPVVRNGQIVNDGQVIGNSDNSGMATGPHLHITYRPCLFCPKDDPMKKLPPPGTCK